MQPSVAPLGPSTVLAKTVQARRALRDNSFPGSRAQRLFLIIVDGRKTLAQLAAPLRALGLDEPALRRLLDAGWLGINPPASLGSAEAAPARRPARAARPRTLGAAKMFALDLLARILPAGEPPLREAARRVHTEAELRAWIAEAGRRIGEQAGPDRAEVFLRRVLEALPPAADRPADQPAELPADRLAA
jgi:hypothetical protein